MAINPPIGAVTPFAGPGPGEAEWENRHGWLLCDGRSLDRKASNGLYQPLFDAIGSSWGGDGVNKFNLPDLQGMFLRGVDGKANRDPDKTQRTALNPGGHAGNQVGSQQPGGLQSHNHDSSVQPVHRLFMSAPRGGCELKNGMSDGDHFGDNGASGIARSSISLTLANAGGNETRPINAYVHWIIKFRD